jgi:uncharacterized LabA/DUF88 family protein
MAKVIVYIDGFNLYYRALRKPEHKWLDVQKLAECLFPEDHIVRVKYFTAMINPSKVDARKHVRQQVYFRALKTLPKVELIYGNYVATQARMPLFEEWKRGEIKLVCVAKQEEKGTDVNLAAHMIRDGFRAEYEAAAVLTSDSDLQEPFRIVVEELGLPVILLHPYVAGSNGMLREPARKLRVYAGDRIKKIREGLLVACQLPDILHDSVGQITRPFEWYADALPPTT